MKKLPVTVAEYSKKNFSWTSIATENATVTDATNKKSRKTKCFITKIILEHSSLVHGYVLILLG
jgi:hypothetical protein